VHAVRQVLAVRLAPRVRQVLPERVVSVVPLAPRVLEVQPVFAVHRV